MNGETKLWETNIRKYLYVCGVGIIYENMTQKSLTMMKKTGELEYFFSFNHYESNHRLERDICNAYNQEICIHDI